MGMYGRNENMFDTKLKPRMLNYLLTDHLPSEDDVFHHEYMDLQKVMDVVRMFGLVSEEFPEEASSKLIEDWAAAVDAWCDRLLSLVTCSRARTCWIGTLLTGMTCQECSSDRFSASYSVWLEALLSNIHPPPGSISVRAASCVSLTNLLIRLFRLGKQSNLKEDGMLHAERVIQPVLELLDKDRSETVLEAAVGLLCTIMEFFPEAIQHNFDAVEAVIVSKIVSGRCSCNTLKMYAHCLALLPKTKGDEDSWSTMLQDLLTSINIHLNEVFYSLEEGREPSSPIQGRIISGEASLEDRRSEKLILSVVSTLILSCSAMLTHSYPVQVTVPVDQLLELVERVLKLKGSYFQDSSALMMITQQELKCSELPVLHLNCLDLLDAIIKGARSQLMPFAESIIGFLKAYFDKCTLPILRIKVYSVIRTWLICINAGALLLLAEEVIKNATVDLDSGGNRSRKELYRGELKSTNTAASPQPGYKKRKHVYSTGSSEEHQSGKCQEVKLRSSPTPRGLKIAALEALETLLTVDGALSSEHLRADADRLLIDVATNVFDEKSAYEQGTGFVSPSEAAWADLMLAALRALLASLLSQPHVNPQYLFQGLELFRKGRGEAERIAQFSAHALLTLELLIHPSKTSDDVPSASQDSSDEGVDHGLPENLYAGGHENKDPIPNPMPTEMDDSSDDDELYDIFVGIGNSTEATSSISPSENTENSEDSSKAVIRNAIESSQADNLLVADAEFPVEEEPGQVEKRRKEDYSMFESKQFLEPVPVEDVKPVAGTIIGSRIGYRKFNSDSDEFDPANYDIKPSKEVLAMLASVKKESDDNSAGTTDGNPDTTDESMADAKPDGNPAN